MQNNTFTRLKVMQQFFKPTLDHINISKDTKTPRRRVILSDSMEKSNSNLSFPWGATRITCQKLRYETLPQAQRTHANTQQYNHYHTTPEEPLCKYLYGKLFLGPIELWFSPSIGHVNPDIHQNYINTLRSYNYHPISSRQSEN